MNESLVSLSGSIHWNFFLALKTQSKVNQKATETISQIRTVKVFVQEKLEIDLYKGTETFNDNNRSLSFSHSLMTNLNS
jgi:ABC-type multidrug transport system fused ATPase/permease subunit